MRKLLNTLYVTRSDAYLKRENENVLISVDNEIRFRMPIHNLEGIVTFGYTGASPGLMHLCASRGVSLAFLSPSGRLLAKVVPPIKGNVLLRKRQYELSDEIQSSIGLARNFIFGKVLNSRSVLRRFVRDHADKPRINLIEQAITQLDTSISRIRAADSLDVLRGLEGEAAKIYYQVFDHLILEAKETFSFTGRNRRPPLDPTNALLSFLYSLLANDCASALETVGLDPQVGFLHRIRPGRSSLALDLMEELRPYLVDRQALSLINTRQILKSDFVEKETGAVLLNDEGRKKVIDAWQSRKQQEIIHPYFEEKIEVGLIPYSQAMLLARCIRGDIDGYPPFLIR